MFHLRISAYSRLVEAPWWGPALGGAGLAWWLEAVDAGALAPQPLRRRQGLLHAVADLLKHLGHRLQVRFSWQALTSTLQCVFNVQQ